MTNMCRTTLITAAFVAGLYAGNRAVAREAQKIVQPPRRWTRT